METALVRVLWLKRTSVAVGQNGTKAEWTEPARSLCLVH